MNTAPSNSIVIPERMELLDIGRLLPSARNARIHSDQQIEQIARSIEAFGFMTRVLVDSAGVIIAGHARVLAAQKLRLETIPVTIVDHLSESEKNAYRVADNKLAENAEWNDELLRRELEALQGEGIELAMLGFSQDELDALIQNLETEPFDRDDEAVPESLPRVVTQPGDIWRLGPHRLLCGDATESAAYTQILDEPADMVFTDPPYNVNYQAPGSGATIQNDALGKQFGAFLQRACTEMLRHCRGALYICMSSSELHTLQHAFSQAGGHWSTFLIWTKSTFTLGRSDYQRQYEPILYGWREGGPHYWCGKRDQSDVWLFDKPRVNDLHPTMKPVELIEQAISNSSRRGDLVLDAFAGSGSTLIACQKLARVARLIEIDPAYCDVIVRRWQHFTGKEAILEREGLTFEQAAARVQAEGASTESGIVTEALSAEALPEAA